ncbi:MAG: tetratricopeptide repeat protein [Candidatus Alcyoniella australis]|nr:tetratricopeptide repeat protein [Candidatus Alcyoniella australis]
MLKQPDEFVSTTTEAISWAAEHYRLLVAVGAALLVVLSAVLIVRNIQHTQMVKANELFGQANVAYNAFVDPTGEGVDAEGVRHQMVFKTEQDKFSKSLESFELVTEKYPDTSVGMLSLMFCGHCLVKLGEYERAREYYDRFLKTEFDDLFMRQLAQSSIGETYMAQSQWDAASQSFELLSNEALDSLRPSILFNLGMSQELGDKTDQAIATYGTLVREYAGNPLAKSAMERTAALGGSPFGSGANPDEPNIRLMPMDQTLDIGE